MNVLELLQKMKAVCPIPSLVSVHLENKDAVCATWEYPVTYVDKNVRKHVLAVILFWPELDSPEAVGIELELAGRKMRKALMEDLDESHRSKNTN